MTEREALEILWSWKGFPLKPKGPEFLYATTKLSVSFDSWNGIHPVEENTTNEIKPGGTRVIVTMVSRLGDVGIRARKIDEARHGYDARVDPRDLTDWSTEP